MDLTWLDGAEESVDCPGCGPEHGLWLWKTVTSEDQMKGSTVWQFSTLSSQKLQEDARAEHTNPQAGCTAFLGKQTVGKSMAEPAVMGRARGFRPQKACGGWMIKETGQRQRITPLKRQMPLLCLYTGLCPGTT